MEKIFMDAKEVLDFLEEYKAKTQELNLTCFKELVSKFIILNQSLFFEITDNYFPEWKPVRSSKTKRISSSGISIPVKLYYEKE